MRTPYITAFVGLLLTITLIPILILSFSFAISSIFILLYEFPYGTIGTNLSNTLDWIADHRVYFMGTATFCLVSPLVLDLYQGFVYRNIDE